MTIAQNIMELVEYTSKNTIEHIEGLDKMNPDPINGSKEKCDIYRKSRGEKGKQEAGLDWIQEMPIHEFQERLIKETLPEFSREQIMHTSGTNTASPPKPCLTRQTNHPYGFLTEKQIEAGFSSEGYLHRDELRYMSVEQFKKKYYS